MSMDITASASPRREAQGENAHDSVNTGEIAIGVIIGRTSEFFDFFVSCHCVSFGLPKAGLSFRRPAHRHALLFCDLCTRLYRTADRHHDLYGRRSRLWSRHQADNCVVPSRNLHCGGRILAGTRPDRLRISLASALLRIGQGLALGGTWDGLAPLLR